MQGMIGIYTVEQLEIFISKNFGDLVSWSKKQKNLTKFGSNPDISTALEDVWNVGGVETLPTIAQGNVITHFASDSASDTGTMVVEGHTQDANGLLTFVVQTVTLLGTAKTALTTPLARATRAYNNGSVDYVGNIYVARDVTFSLGIPVSDIHLKIDAGFNQTQKCSTSISKDDYWVVSQFTGSVFRTQTRNVDFFVQTRALGGVWRTQTQPFSASTSSGTILIPAPQPFVVPPNTDLRVQAISSGATTQVGASVYGTLMTKVNP